MTATRCTLVALMAVASAGFGLAPASRGHARSSRSLPASMKTWSKRQTLADTVGGQADKGAAAVGLIGTIPVEFTQGNDTRTTMAIQGQPLSEVAAQAGQFIKYKCGKGECGTCEVKVDGKWIRTCAVQVPFVPDGEKYSVWVRPSMVKVKKASKFFSFRSFLAGARNNILGMIGFVREGRKSQNSFQERLDREADILARAAAKKKAKAEAMAKAQGQ
eukprot:CAMPEP_0174718244 /NCGR_PEP_ID=MMETSP1094-20130205/28388_1 /TAXON_ID=156173 /ORGANISM="Chrysochromulina brevifilum, Strain UTEX LB 985" /LENGTH=217 /DNA_ID=CAMNT_0015918299 /DNA_START=13 /DNA_END=666 /DNA_ORIENTATION=+